MATQRVLLDVPRIDPRRFIPSTRFVHTSTSMPTISQKSGPKMIDLFSGCGGLSLGLEQAGFEPLLFSELNKDAAATYLANRRHLANLKQCGDIYSLSNEDLKSLLQIWRSDGVNEIDLVCGGPPCQGYSGIGIRRTFKLEKEEIPSNHLFKEMIRVIEVVKPKFFLFENVRGLLNGRWSSDGEKGEIWEDVRSAFEAIEGYSVSHALVQAKQYGVPQNRPRVLLVGIRDDLGWKPDNSKVAAGLLPQPTDVPPDPIDVFGDLVDPEYACKRATTSYPSDPQSAFQERMRTHASQTAGKGAPVTEHEYSEHSDKIREKFLHMLRNSGEIPAHMRTKKFAQRVIPEEWGADGPNITATSLPDDYVHFCQPRTLTVREWARLQTFPDWYCFAGPRTTGGRRRAGDPSEGIWDRDVPKYTQIGNAVPVMLAEKVGLHLAKMAT